MVDRRRVALFVTCIVDQLMPEIGVAAVRLLRRAGYEVDFPAAQTCCGQPFFNSGFRAEAWHLARRTIEIFEPYDAVVLPSGSCTTMLRAEYAHLFKGDPEWHPRAHQLAKKAFELCEFLVQQAHWEPKAVARPPVLTYHDSCHMSRTLKLHREPRQLLAAAGCRIHEMQESDRCCGFGGLFSIRMPELSNAMTGEKLRQAGETTAPLLVTSDPGCLLQMRGLASRDGVRIEHLATVLEEVTR